MGFGVSMPFNLTLLSGTVRYQISHGQSLQEESEADIEKYWPHDPGNHKSGTRLSRHCGQLAANNIPYTITWRILKETKTAFNPTTGFCVLFNGKIPDNVQARGCHSEPQVWVLQSLPSQRVATPQRIVNLNFQAMIIVMSYVIIFFFWYIYVR